MLNTANNLYNVTRNRRKGLESLTVEAQSFWKPAITKPMTIAIGMLCNESIMLASDSQTTSDNIKETGIDKIHGMSAVKAHILVAQAGNADRSWRAFEILRDAAKNTEITDYRTIADLARKAMLKVREELRQQQFNCSPEELDDYIWKHDQQCWLMIAHYFEGTPQIFTVDLATGAANLKTRACDCCRHPYPNQHYAAVGTGSALASYLLHEFTKADMPYLAAISAILYIVEEVKKHDTYCSGDTKVGIIGKDNDHWFPRQDKLAKFAKELKNFNKPFQSQWSGKLVQSISKIGKEHLEKPSQQKATHQTSPVKVA